MKPSQMPDIAGMMRIRRAEQKCRKAKVEGVDKKCICWNSGSDESRPGIHPDCPIHGHRSTPDRLCLNCGFPGVCEFKGKKGQPCRDWISKYEVPPATCENCGTEPCPNGIDQTGKCNDYAQWTPDTSFGRIGSMYVKDASYICKAVNCHDQLTEALREVLRAFVPSRDKFTNKNQFDAFRMANDALAKSEAMWK